MLGTGQSEPALAVAVLGMSAGGLPPLRDVVCALPSQFAGALVVAQHVAIPSILPELITAWTRGRHRARSITDGMLLEAGTIYVCPAQHHVFINPDATLGLSTRDRIDFVRPSIDWLFESAAASFADRCVAVVLSGANADGARGARLVSHSRGRVLVQAPSEAWSSTMPESALATCPEAKALPARDIASELISAFDSVVATSTARECFEPFEAVG